VILRRAENGVSVSELCREHGMSNASFYKWRAKYGGMDALMVSQMKAMEEENRRLKRMNTDLSMQNDLLNVRVSVTIPSREIRTQYWGIKVTKAYRFVCLDPRKAKRQVIEKTISELGTVTWFKLAPLAIKKYPEAYARAEAAYDTATKKYSNALLKKAKIILLMFQYGGSRSYFEKNNEAVAVAWNGLNGTRRVFMDGARDAGARTLFFELSPFKGRITADPCGVNYSNSLPRDAVPYLKWRKSQIATDLHSVRDKIRARKPSKSKPSGENERSLAEPFLFVPLQVPGDSQLRIYGGKFKTVEATIEGIAAAARSLPDGWHVRIKEHPSAPQSHHDYFRELSHDKIILDNQTDTFTQVAASRGVVTVNSSVGL
jgi:capsular polysaccharide export protein